METSNVNINYKTKGGRPKVIHKKRQALSVMCNILEKKIIQSNARGAGVSVSVYLRNLGLHGRTITRIKSLPNQLFS